MPSNQWHNDKGQSYSQSNSSVHGSHNEGGNVTDMGSDKSPRWRRMLASKRFWIIAITAMLLLGLVLGLGIGLTVGRSQSSVTNNQPGSLQPYPIQPSSPQPGSPQPSSSRPPAQLLGPIVDLGYTRYQGDSYPNGISQWLGIRYAQPPLGDLRFAAPQNVTPNNALQMATQRGQNCIGTRQSVNQKPIISGNEGEDCLNLDIYAPSNVTSESKLPVYFFIQGGGFNSAYPTQNGTALIQASGGNIMVVSVNYRVSIYGFLASAEVQTKGSLNNGLKDQRMALQWVQDNINKFGGDPGHVVIGGPSAGGGSVVLQLTAYGGRQDSLFHASAAESQSFAALRTVEESQYQYDNLLQRTQCTAADSGSSDTLSCLRKLNLTMLQEQNIIIRFPNTNADALFPYAPTLDLDFIPRYTLDLFNTGGYLKLPAIWGDVSNEGTVFVPKSQTNTVSQSNDFLKAQYPEFNRSQLDIIQTLYPPEPQNYPNIGNAGKYWRSTSDAYGHQRYICPGYFVNNITAFYKSKNANAGNWNYHYNVSDPNAIDAGLGTPHVAEQSAIWAKTNPASYQGVNKPIIPLMQGYWISFIRTFNPNTIATAGAPVWKDWGDMSPKGGNQLLINSPDQHGGYSTSMTQLVDQTERDNCAQLLAWGVAIKQ